MSRQKSWILAGLFFFAMSALFLGRGLSPDGLLSPPAFLAGSLVRDAPTGPVPAAGMPTRPIWALDHLILLAPYAEFIQAELLAGRLPLWNPLIGTGLPVIEALQPALVHPFTLLLLVMPADSAASLLVLVRLALAGLGGFLLARALGSRAEAAALCGLLFMLAPFHLSYRLHTLPNVSATLPYLMLISERALRGASLRRCGAAWSLVAALAFVGGHSETVVHVFAAAWAYHLLRAAAVAANGSRWRSIGNGLLFLTACSALSAAASAVVLWGHVQTVLDSNLLAFREFGSERGLPDVWSLLIPTQNYSGMLALLLAGLGLRVRAAIPAWTWLAMGLLTLLAIYQPGPIATVIDTIPVLRTGLHGRALFIVHLVIAVLAARGLGATPSPKTTVAVMITGTLLALGLLGVWFADVAPGARARYGFPVLLETPWVFLALGVLLLLLPSRWVSRPARALCVVALTFVELYAVHGPVPHDFPASYPPLRSNLRFADARTETSRFLIPGQLLRANVNMVYDFPALSVYDATIGQRQMQILQLAGLSAVAAVASARPEPAPQDLRLLDLLGVRYILTESPISNREVASRLKLLTSDSFWMYRNPGALPRAFVVEEAIVARRARHAAQLIMSPDVDLRRVVILEEPAPTMASGPPARVSLEAHISQYHPGDVRITASSPHGGYLVFTETYLSGWQATVGGSPAPVLRADLSLVSVPVPPGVHEVTLKYRPLHLTVGAAVSGSVILALLVAACAPPAALARVKSVEADSGSVGSPLLPT